MRNVPLPITKVRHTICGCSNRPPFLNETQASIFYQLLIEGCLRSNGHYIVTLLAGNFIKNSKLKDLTLSQIRTAFSIFLRQPNVCFCQSEIENWLQLWLFMPDWAEWSLWTSLSTKPQPKYVCVCLRFDILAYSSLNWVWCNQPPLWSHSVCRLLLPQGRLISWGEEEG